MKLTDFPNQNEKKWCKLAHNWLLLTAIVSFTVLLLCLSSCVPPLDNNTGQRASKKDLQYHPNSTYSKSKKYKNMNRNRPEKNELEDNNDYYDNTSNNNYYDDPVMEFEKRLQQQKSNTRSNQTKHSNNNNGIEQNQNNRALPSLKEQIDELNQKYNDLDNNIANIKEDLIDIKEILSNLEPNRFQPTAGNNQQQQINHHINPNSTQNHALIQNEEQNQSKQQFQAEPTNIQQHNLIINDESQNNIKATKPPAIPENTTPKKPNSNFKIVKTDEKNTKSPTTPVQQNSKNEVAPQQQTPSSQEKITQNNTTNNDFSEIISNIAKKDFNTAIKLINSKINSKPDDITLANCNY